MAGGRRAVVEAQRQVSDGLPLSFFQVRAPAVGRRPPARSATSTTGSAQVADLHGSVRNASFSAASSPSGPSEETAQGRSPRPPAPRTRCGCSERRLRGLLQPWPLQGRHGRRANNGCCNGSHRLAAHQVAAGGVGQNHKHPTGLGGRHLPPALTGRSTE